MLTPIGLLLNFVGSIILLGSDVKRIKQILERIDPIHRMYLRGLNKIRNKSVDENMLGEKAYPYEGPVSAIHWNWWAIRRFLDRHAEQDVSRNAEVDISGGGFKINGEQLTFPEDRTVQLNEKERLHVGKTLSLNAVFGLLYEARVKRVYIYGVSLLASGFLLQFIDSFNILDLVPLFS